MRARAFTRAPNYSAHLVTSYYLDIIYHYLLYTSDGVRDPVQAPGKLKLEKCRNLFDNGALVRHVPTVQSPYNFLNKLG
jgi:hypothetical protein